MLRRPTLTATPPDGDYILSPTGYSWNVRRSIRVFWLLRRFRQSFAP
jgi:hypothetical protein